MMPLPEGGNSLDDMRVRINTILAFDRRTDEQKCRNNIALCML